MPGTSIIPIKKEESGSKLIITPEETTERTLKELGVTKADLEEFVRTNVKILFQDSEETLLIVGQQVRNKALGRSDLVALDGQGNIVLIELKRDKNDMVARREAFEFQAVRYATNYALIKTPPDIVQQLFVPYIGQHREELQFKQELAIGLTASELATRRLDEFLKGNKAQATFNHYKRIILIAAAYDEQTLSGCAWLAKNGINVRCITISPNCIRKPDLLQNRTSHTAASA